MFSDQRAVPNLQLVVFVSENDLNALENISINQRYRSDEPTVNDYSRDGNNRGFVPL
jgi:hypothetical protein